MIYFAGPIDHYIEHTDYSKKRIAAKKVVETLGEVVYDPSSAFSGVYANNTLNDWGSIIRINTCAIKRSRCMIVWDGDSFSRGTWREVEFAVTNMVPVYVVSSNKTVAMHECLVYSSIEKLVEGIRNVV